MSIKQELHQLIDLLEEGDKESAREFLSWLLSDDDVLTDEELAAVQEAEYGITHGEYVTLDELDRSLRL